MASIVIADWTPKRKNPDVNLERFVGVPRAMRWGILECIEWKPNRFQGRDALLEVNSARRDPNVLTNYGLRQRGLRLTPSGTALTCRSPYPTRRSNFSSLGTLALESRMISSSRFHSASNSSSLRRNLVSHAA